MIKFLLVAVYMSAATDGSDQMRIDHIKQQYVTEQVCIANERTETVDINNGQRRGYVVVSCMKQQEL